MGAPAGGEAGQPLSVLGHSEQAVRVAGVEPPPPHVGPAPRGQPGQRRVGQEAGIGLPPRGDVDLADGVAILARRFADARHGRSLLRSGGRDQGRAFRRAASGAILPVPRRGPA